MSFAMGLIILFWVYVNVTIRKSSSGVIELDHHASLMIAISFVLDVNGVVI